MHTKSVREKSIEKIKLLRDPVAFTAFGHYFARNWEAKKILDELRSAGADIERLREWALYSFHPLGIDEAEEKRERGKKAQTQLKKAIAGYENAISFYSVYASAPHFNWPESVSISNKSKHLMEMNQYLAVEARQILGRATAKGVYTTKRLGVIWASYYLYLIKSYIAGFTHWDKRKILGAMVHLITAAHKSVRIEFLVTCARCFESPCARSRLTPGMPQSLSVCRKRPPILQSFRRCFHL